MKRILLFIFFANTALYGFSQTQATNIVSITKADYLKKAKGQNTAAWVLAIGGSVLDIAAIVTVLSEPFLAATQEEQKKNDTKENTATWLFITGTAAVVGSIPLFIASHNNHKKALHVAINMRSFPQLKVNNIYAISYPALTLQFRL